MKKRETDFFLTLFPIIRRSIGKTELMGWIVETSHIIL